MADDAVARVMKAIREREDATRVATRDAEKALVRLARLKTEVDTQRVVLAGAVERVEEAGLLTVEQLAGALGVDKGSLGDGKTVRSGARNGPRTRSGADARMPSGAAGARNTERHVEGRSQ